MFCCEPSAQGQLFFISLTGTFTEIRVKRPTFDALQLQDVNEFITGIGIAAILSTYIKTNLYQNILLNKSYCYQISRLHV